MADNDISQKLAFLYKIIDDNQATIRFLDTKAAFGIAVLGAMIGKVLDRDQLIGFESHGPLVLCGSIVFGLLMILSVSLGFKTVFPTINPAQNVSFPDDLDPKFFIFKLKPKKFWRLFSGNKKYATLETTHSGYCESLARAVPETLQSIAAAEVLKLSFIRQLKTDRLSAFSKSLVFTVVAFIIVILAAPKAVPTNVASEATQRAETMYYTNNASDGCLDGGTPLYKPGNSRKRATTSSSRKDGEVR